MNPALVPFACPVCGSTEHHPVDALEGYCAVCSDWTGERLGGLRGPRYWTRDGEPMRILDWQRRFDDLGYRHVAVTAVGDVEVSTVWLGLDHRFLGDGPPLIFETMVFGGPLDQHVERYSTVAAALAGHERWVAAVRSGGPPAS